jgi:signal transduction histidine kinase
LRTPLASIRVFGEFLRLGRVTQPDKICEYGQYIEYIETESRRLTQLINNILDFSKIESGQRTYHFEPTDIGEVVAETVKLLDVRLSHGGVKLVLDTPPEPLPLAVVDPDALIQALVNLLDNAVKYSGSAKEIQVRLAQTNAELSIAVTDYGIGIPHEQQDKIFDKFYRVGTGLVHEVKGSGLGLSIVQHIAEAHRGYVSVESQPGHGSTFTIHLPVTTEQTDKGVEEQAKIAQSGCPVLGMLAKG